VWFALQAGTPSEAYNIAQYADIGGPVDERLMTLAIHQARAEMDAARVVLVEASMSLTDQRGQVTDGLPQQLVLPVGDPDLEVVDLAGRADAAVKARRLMREDTLRPLDLMRDPLYRLTLFRLSGHRFFLYLRIHHIAIDGAGAVAVVHRLAEIYTALSWGVVCPPQSGQGLDFLLRQESAYRRSAAFDRDREYWRGQLTGAREPASFSPRSAMASPGSLRSTGRVTVAGLDQLRDAARQARTAWQAGLVAAVAAYLYRISGDGEVVLGFPVACRTSEDLRNTPGVLANVVPLRLSVTADLSMIDLVRQTSNRMREVLRHQRFRHEDMRRLVAIPPGVNLFGPVVNVKAFEYDLRFGEARATMHNIHPGPVEDLSIDVYIDDENGGLRIDVEGNPACYDDVELRKHRDRFLRLLDELSADPGRLIGEVDLLSATEREQILVGWNDTAAGVAARALPELFEAQVARTPGAIAVVFEDTVISYSELNLRANRLAHLLIGRGVGPERVVAIALPRSVELRSPQIGVGSNLTLTN
jgi:nonribosomal peptide synthetase DhbF